jgi:hypothetical protein
VVGAALSDRPHLTGGALATAAFRPYLALERAVGAAAPDGGPAEVAAWLLARLADRVLVVEDLHLAHPATAAVLERVAGRAPLVVTVATGGPDRVLDRLRGWGPLAPATVTLGPVPDDVARAIALAAAPLPPAAVERVVAAGGGIPAWLVAGALAEAGHDGDPRLPALVARLDLAARTALAAAGLLGRPAAATLLGPGVPGLAGAGLARVDDDGLVHVVGVAARAAVAKLTPADRAALHAAIGTRLADPGEAARHLAAAGRAADAVAAARRAAASAADPLERAAHLHFAATVQPGPGPAAAAVDGLLAVGDLATALGWVDVLVEAGPDGCARAARVCRLAGATGRALAAARTGLATAAPRSAVWRALLVELPGARRPTRPGSRRPPPSAPAPGRRRRRSRPPPRRSPPSPLASRTRRRWSTGSTWPGSTPPSASPSGC